MAEDTPTDPIGSPPPNSEHPTDPAPPEDPRPAFWPLPDGGLRSAAGVIDNLRHGGLMGTVSVLYCERGSVRANHWHRNDSHWLYVVDGVVEYYERPIGSTELPEMQRFGEREMFYTPPQREHAMRFPDGAILVSMSTQSRTHEEHEADVVRLNPPMIT